MSKQKRNNTKNSTNRETIQKVQQTEKKLSQVVNEETNMLAKRKQQKIQT